MYQPGIEAVWTVMANATGQVCPSPLELTPHQCACIPDVEHDATGFHVFPVGCQSCLGPLLSRFLLMPPVWYGSAYPILL